MPIDRNIFKILGAKTQARDVANIEDANYIRRFFNTVQGYGCRVDAPRQDGKGWRIIVDGSTDIDIGEESIFNKMMRSSFPARIDGNEASSSYTFKELVPADETADNWSDRDDGGDPAAAFRAGTAWEINGNTTLVIGGSVSSQLRVTMHESPEGVYWFDLPIPHMDQYEAITALEDGEPRVDELRFT